MTRWTKILALVGVVVVIVFAVLGVGLFDDDGDSGPELVEPECVEVAMPSMVQSGAEFEVSFRFAEDPSPNCSSATDSVQITPPLTLVLWDGDKKLNTLISGSPPSVGPPEDAMVPAVLRRGPGPFTFALPELDNGNYVLCSSVSVAPSTDPAEAYDAPFEPFCREVTVRS